jgi:hypothetical protein
VNQKDISQYLGAIWRNKGNNKGKFTDKYVS